MADKKDKRNSFLSFKLGKDKKDKKQNATMPPNARLSSYSEEGTNGGNESAKEVIGRLSDKEALEQFERMLDDMNLSDEKKAPLRDRNVSFKRHMLEMQYKAPAKQGELDTPSSFLTELRNADLKGDKRLRVLESLRVSLTSNPVR